MLLLRFRSSYLFLYLFVWREKGKHSVLITKQSPSPRRKGEKDEWWKIKEKTGVAQKVSFLDTFSLVQSAFSGEIPAQGFVFFSPSYLSQPVGRENSSSESAAQISTSAPAETQPVPRTLPGDEFPWGKKKKATPQRERIAAGAPRKSRATLRAPPYPERTALRGICAVLRASRRPLAPLPAKLRARSKFVAFPRLIV